MVKRYYLEDNLYGDEKSMLVISEGDPMLEKDIYNDYRDYTDELEGMEEVDSWKKGIYKDVLYDLRNGKQVIITYTSKEGVLPVLKFLDREYQDFTELKVG